jgi:hypothetical protein
MIVNDGLERVWKQAVVSYYYSDSYMEGLKETTKIHSQGDVVPGEIRSVHLPNKSHSSIYHTAEYTTQNRQHKYTTLTIGILTIRKKRNSFSRKSEQNDSNVANNRRMCETCNT